MRIIICSIFNRNQNSVDFKGIFEKRYPQITHTLFIGRPFKVVCDFKLTLLCNVEIDQFSYLRITLITKTYHSLTLTILWRNEE